MNVLPEQMMLPPQTIMGAGKINRFLADAMDYGSRGVLVHGKSMKDSGVLDKVLNGASKEMTLESWTHAGGEPTLAHLNDLLDFCRERNVQWVAAVGGGSVIDIAKAAAGLLEARGNLVEYHDGAAFPGSRIPFLAAPSTAGTGSECTMVSVLTNSDVGVKKSIRHPSFMARLVVLDPDLLNSCPPSVIAASGLDAFTQAVEAYISKNASWFSDWAALRAVSLISRSLEAVFKGERGAVQQDLMTGSYLAGIALGNARLGIVHGLAHPLGARYGVPHGLACAICLPHAVRFNKQAMGGKYVALSQEVEMDLQERIQSLMNMFKLASPFTGKSIEDRDAIVKETLMSGSTKANPRPVMAADVESLLDLIFEG